MIVKTFFMHTVGHHGFSDPFGRSNEPRSEHTPHLNNFRVLIHTIFWVIGIPTQKCQICSWTSVKTLSMHTVGHHGFSDQFGRSNKPQSEHTPHFDDFNVLVHTIFWVIGIPMSKMPNFFVDVCQDVFYAYGWPSRLFRPIWKVKRAPKRAYASF